MLPLLRMHTCCDSTSIGLANTLPCTYPSVPKRMRFMLCLTTGMSFAGSVSCLHDYLIRVCCSSREVERGDRVVWGTTGNNQIGILHPGALPVRYEYDTVLDEHCSNQHVRLLQLPSYAQLSHSASEARGVSFATLLQYVDTPLKLPCKLHKAMAR